MNRLFVYDTERPPTITRDPRTFYSRLQLLVNAAIAGSRVGS